MKRLSHSTIITLLLAAGFMALLAGLLILPASATPAAAPHDAAPGQGYDLCWWSIDGGGGALDAGKYLLQGAIGQPDAAAPLISGRYRLTGGFWSVPMQPSHPLYLPLIGKNAH